MFEKYNNIILLNQNPRSWIFSYLLKVNKSKFLQNSNICKLNVFHFTPMRYYYLGYLQLYFSVEESMRVNQSYNQILNGIKITEFCGNSSEYFSVLLTTLKEYLKLLNIELELSNECYHFNKMYCFSPIRTFNDLDSSMEQEIGNMIASLSKVENVRKL